MNYANIIVDNRSDSTDTPYTYRIPAGQEAAVGSMVHIPFARSKSLRTGYVLSLQDSVEEKLAAKIRPVDYVDEEISLTGEIMRTAVWMRNRYVCRYIDAVRCFLPAGHRPARRLQPDPAEEDSDETDPASQLTAEQENALTEIGKAVESGEHARFLLRGVTGSGKTEVYMRAARKVIRQGRTVIVLVPEISLTLQIIRRFTAVFGRDRIAVMHSRMTPAQRYEQWQRIRRGETDIVIGARSAVFAPLEKIGLIVIDEEHEATYKSDATPKYDTVEVAIKRAADPDQRAVLILGSATPSVASYRRGQEGIYRILTMEKRYNETPLPRVEIADMREELRRGNRSVLSGRLDAEMRCCLSEEKQVMLFLNRRGYSTFVSCRECGYVVCCPVCGLSLTYHSSSRRLVCHYCGHEEELPKNCPECGSGVIRHFGTGTEKVEETIRQNFPDAETDRIDLDSIRRKGELKRRLAAFETGKTRILIGTQIIAKGLDFRNVGLVGIISADISLSIPDYRSPERAFQLITQAAGRAGRGREIGSVVIQTYQPDHYAVALAAKQDYEGFYREEIRFREAMRYPPFSDMIQVLFTAKDPRQAEQGARQWCEAVRAALPPEDRRNVFSPQEAYMSRIRDTYRYSLVIRCERGKRRMVTEILRKQKEKDAVRRAPWLAVADINPYSFA